MSSYEAERQGEQAQEGCCGCVFFLLQTGVVVWILSSFLGLWKATLVAVVMTITTWILAFMGIIPFVGQWLYKLFAKEVIIWLYGLLQVNPDIKLSMPGWINSFVKWILCTDELFGVWSCIKNPSLFNPTLAEYTFGAGYTLSILVSLSVVVAIIFTIARKIQLSRVDQD